MSSFFKLQVPADCHNLVLLLSRLGILVGPMKAVKFKDYQIDIWFVPGRGTSHVKRARAFLERGMAQVCNGSPRRVYLDLSVQDSSGEWREFSDEDYSTAGLQPDWEYDGESHVGVLYDVGRLEGEWWDAGTDWVVNATESIPYYRFLKGDRDRAIAEAEVRIAQFEARQLALS